MDESAEKRTASDDDERYEAFVRLLVEHEPRVRSFLRGLLPTWHDVEEVTQEASLVAWRKFDDFEEGTSFGGWLFTIARFEAMKYRRRVARSPLVFANDIWDLLAEEASAEEGQQIRRRHLEVCLGKLELSKRELLLKVHTSGVVMREVAKQLGKGEQAFYKMIQRLRAVVVRSKYSRAAKVLRSSATGLQATKQGLRISSNLWTTHSWLRLSKS